MKTTDSPEVVTREIGERINVHLGLDQELTKDLGEGMIEAVVTTSSIDRQGESLKTTGINTVGFMATGGPVLYGHDYSSLPIGKTISLTEGRNKIKAVFKMAIEEYPFAKTVYDLIKGGYLNAVSIGGIVRQWSEDYTTVMKMDMVEFSVVPVPANEEAIITSRSLEEMTGKSIDTIKGEFEEFSSRVMLDKIKSMGDDEVEDALRVLKSLIARLEESAITAPALADAKPIKIIRRYRLKDAQALNFETQRIVKIIKYRG